MIPYCDYHVVGLLMLMTVGPLGAMGQDCGGALNKDSPTRNFTSPNYPGPIPARTTCEWIIEAPMGQVQLQFDYFTFAPSTFGCTDFNSYVSMNDGSSTSAPSLGQYCGDENGIYAPPAVVMSSSGSLLVRFYSGGFGLTSGQGFIATFSFPDHADCTAVVCQNGGTCTDTPNGYNCSCATGFTGLQCETVDVDYCASSPCANGGTCVDGTAGFQCLCTSEYVGTRCQVLKSSCLLPLGMANGDIEDSQISASTETPLFEAYKGRLNGPRAWQPDVVNTNQWLQVNFNNRTIITGIQTQGLWGGHVKSYRLLYGDTENDLSAYQETGSNSGKVFSANSDGPTVVSNDLDHAITTAIIRVNPQDYTTAFIRLRIELLGCEDNIGVISNNCCNNAWWRNYRGNNSTTYNNCCCNNNNKNSNVAYGRNVGDSKNNSTKPMVETSAKVTTMKTSTPLSVKTTKPELKKTTESNSKFTTGAKDGGKVEQSGGSGGGGNTAVFAAAGAAGGVVVLVGVGVTVFICRRRGRNSEACGVPMEHLGKSNIDPKPFIVCVHIYRDNTGAEVAIGNPLYGAINDPNKLGLAVNDSCA
ncbi:EDIL3 [Branchiostoma lanceolatum]|uniref:EDIL3 protein n=1 Tax=Branchiostoma lanceolatum TaxID=7740 RepID=A0A8J9ZZZ0_BRALA|nr:EDIL3 [Branchiostoma lanceolatum]